MAFNVEDKHIKSTREKLTMWVKEIAEMFPNTGWTLKIKNKLIRTTDAIDSFVCTVLEC